MKDSNSSVYVVSSVNTEYMETVLGQTHKLDKETKCFLDKEDALAYLDTLLEIDPDYTLTELELTK